MFDYKLLSALAAVVEQAGFERAAQVLGLSQSAISQRIKLLEARVGQPVLVRGTPPAPTEIGRRLLNHVQQVRLLERDLQTLVPALDEEGLPERLRIALNADSLATWWAQAVGEFCAEQHLLMDLVVEDQTVGLKRMRAGEVAACLCASERPVAGARSVLLGAMRYRALASPAFIARHFPKACAPISWPEPRRWCSARTTSCSIATWRPSASMAVSNTIYARRPKALSASRKPGLAGGWCRSYRCASNWKGAYCWSFCQISRSMCRCTGIIGAMAVSYWGY